MPKHEVKGVLEVIEREFRLPQLSVYLFPKVAEPEEHKKTAIPEVKDIREVAPVEKKEDMKPSESKMLKGYDCGKGRTTPLPKAELRIRNIFVENSHH